MNPGTRCSATAPPTCCGASAPERPGGSPPSASTRSRTWPAPTRANWRRPPRWTGSPGGARFGCWEFAPNWPADPSAVRGRRVEAAYLQDLGAERLKPGQEAVQRGLVGQDAVNHGPDRLHAGVELLEV